MAFLKLSLILLCAGVPGPGAPGGIVGGATRAAPAPGLSGPGLGRLGSPGCRPSCRGRICGDDGCGGSCGACGEGRTCLRNRCVKGTGDPCARIAGRWVGAMAINPVHQLDGRVRGTRKACRAQFRVTFNQGYRTGWVVQDMVVTFLGGGRVRFAGRRIVSNGSGSPYSLDTFTGRLDAARTRFVGTLRDTRNVTGPVRLQRR